MEEEIWKPVKGFERRFQISNFGRLKSFNGRHKGERILACYLDALGYMAAQLTMIPLKRKVRIHTLVAEHFVEKRLPEHIWVNHIDGNKLNNHYSNLEWCTPLRNCQHAVETGLHNLKGEKHPHSKLTKEQVIEMRRLYNDEKLTHKAIGEIFGVCRRQAGDVINGVNWGWLTQTAP